MHNLDSLLSEEQARFYVEVTAQDASRAAQVYNDEPQFQLYIDKESSFKYISDDLDMMITFLQRLGDRHVEITDSNVGEHMDDREADFELEEKKGTDKDGDGDIDSDDYLLARSQAIKDAMKGKKIKKSQLKELVKRAISEQPMGMGGQAKGAVQLPKATNPTDIKKLTDKGVDVKLAELELKHFDYTDEEGRMAKSDLLKIAKYASRLFNMLQDETQLEGWIQAKITKASDYISSVMHYLEGEETLGEIRMFHDPVGYKKSEPNPKDLVYTKEYKGNGVYDILKNGEKIATVDGEGSANAYINKLQRELGEVSAEYRPNRPTPKVGDTVGNTVQGFNFTVVGIHGDKMEVEDEKTLIRFMTDINNMYPRRSDESVNEDFAKYDTLKMAIVQHLKGSPYYDKTRLINIFNYLDSPDQERAKREYSVFFGKPVNEGAEGDPEMAFQRVLEAIRKEAKNLGDEEVIYLHDRIKEWGNKLLESYVNEAPEGMYMIKVNPRDYKRAADLVNRSYSRANIQLNDPDTFYTPDIQTAEDLIMDFGVNDIEILDDNLEDYGSDDFSDEFDDIEPWDLNPGMYESKSTCCMKCGHMHVKGTSCPKPFYGKSDPKHCKNRK